MQATVHRLHGQAKEPSWATVIGTVLSSGYCTFCRTVFMMYFCRNFSRSSLGISLDAFLTQPEFMMATRGEEYNVIALRSN